MFDVKGYVDWIKQNITIKDIMILLGLVVLYALTRLINLDNLPIFSDEGIYVHWSQVAWKDASMRFISVTDGRQPLQTWGTIPFLKLFESQALIAGRLFSVTTGLFALSGVVASAWYFFNKKTAYIAGFLYIITPYFLFYDRIALVDSAINGFTIWMFFLSVVMARTLRLDVALILGFVTGFALLGKSSVRLYAAFMLASSMFVLYKNEHSLLGMIKKAKSKFFGTENKWYDLISFGVLYAVVVFLAALIYNVQRLSPYMHYIEEKNTTFVLTIPELLASPFNYFKGNIVNIPYYIFTEMGFIVAVLGVVGLFFMYRKHKKLTLYYLLWLIPGLLLISFVARVLYPRYVLSLGGLLILPAAYAVANMRNMKSTLGALGIVVLVVSYFNYTIWFDAAKLPFPEIDRGQYLEGWPAGYGAQEIVDIARDMSTDKPVYIIAQGDFGMSGDVLRTLLTPADKNIHIRAYWPLNREKLLEAENQALLTDNHVLVVYSHCEEPNSVVQVSDDQRCSNFEQTQPLRLIERFEKPGNKSAMYVFELLPATE